MNKFKYDEAKNKLVLDIPRPFKNSDTEGYYTLLSKWESRLSYSLSKELKDKLIDGQVLGENEFTIDKNAIIGIDETGQNYIHGEIAIPLPEAKTDDVVKQWENIVIYLDKLMGSTDKDDDMFCIMLSRKNTLIECINDIKKIKL